MELSERARAARREYNRKKVTAEHRRAYQREWQRAHPEKCREYQRRYWEKKGAEWEAARKEAGGSDGD